MGLRRLGPSRQLLLGTLQLYRGTGGQGMDKGAPTELVLVYNKRSNVLARAWPVYGLDYLNLVK